MTISKHMGNASLIVIKCMIFMDDVLVAKNNGLLSLEIKGELKIVIIKRVTLLVLLCC